MICFVVWGVQQSCWIHGPLDEFIFLCFWRSQVFGTVFTCEVAWLTGGCIRINEDPCHDDAMIQVLYETYLPNKIRRGLLQYVFPFEAWFCFQKWTSCWHFAFVLMFSKPSFRPKKITVLFAAENKYSHLMAFALVGRLGKEWWVRASAQRIIDRIDQYYLLSGEQVTLRPKLGGGPSFWDDGNGWMGDVRDISAGRKDPN